MSDPQIFAHDISALALTLFFVGILGWTVYLLLKTNPRKP
jgi:hypothetical protein